MKLTPPATNLFAQQLTTAGSPQGLDALVTNNNAFSAGYTQGAVAAQFSYSQVRNPAGSGKVVYVDAVLISAGPAAASYVFAQGVALVLGFFNNLFSNYLNPVSSTARLEGTNNAGVLGGGDRFIIGVNANDTQLIVFPYPFRLRESDSLLMRCNTLNQAMTSMWFIREY